MVNSLVLLQVIRFSVHGKVTLEKKSVHNTVLDQTVVLHCITTNPDNNILDRVADTQVMSSISPMSQLFSV